MRKLLVLIGLCVLTVIGAPPAPAEEDPLLQASYSGSREPEALGPQFMRAMERPRVQEALLAFSEGPQEAGVFAASLRGSGLTPADLERLQLIRRHGVIGEHLIPGVEARGRCDDSDQLFTLPGWQLRDLLVKVSTNPILRREPQLLLSNLCRLDIERPVAKEAQHVGGRLVHE